MVPNTEFNYLVQMIQSSLFWKIWISNDVRLGTGAKVKVECKDRKSLNVVYSAEAYTDSTGTYEITISDDHEDELCDAILVESPLRGCSKVDPGRDRSRLSLTRNNGLVSDYRYANAMGFSKAEPASGCTELLKQYQESDD